MADKHSLSEAVQRLGVGSELPGLVNELGADPAALFAEIGVELAAVSPDLRLPFQKLLCVLHRAVQVTGCDHLGLLCGLRFEFRHHGAIGELMQTAQTLRQAMEDFVRWQPGYSSGAIVYLHRNGPDHALGYGIYTGAAPGAEILYDAIIGVAVRMVRLLTKGSVAPIEVHLCRKPPSNGSEYARLLQVPVRFEQDRTCLILDDHGMQARISSADLDRRQATLELIKSHGRWAGLSHSDRVRQEIRRALLGGPVRMSAIAKALGYEVRTLRRRLKTEATSFSALSDEVRLGVARELLDLTNLPIGEIAAATGFASASVFSETFRRWTGTTAMSLRMQNADWNFEDQIGR